MSDRSPDCSWRTKEIRALVHLELMAGGGFLLGALLGRAGASGFRGRDALWLRVVPAAFPIGNLLCVVAVLILAVSVLKGWGRLAAILAVSCGVLGSSLLSLAMGLPVADMGSAWVGWISALAGLLFLVAGAGILERKPWGQIVQTIAGAAGALFWGGLALIAIYLAINLRQAREVFVCTLFSAYFAWGAVSSFRIMKYFMLADEPDFAEQPAVLPEERIGIRSLGAFAISTWVLAVLILYPNITNSWQRGNQRRTMGNLRSVATALEAYAAKRGIYPETRTMDELATLLVPEYIAVLPLRDAWGHPFEYRRVKPADFTLRSPGSDGTFEHADSTAYAGGGVEGFARDIVYSTCSPPQFPEGVMGF